jgi:hypothetical protein
VLTNLVRAGLARARNVPYAPLPTVYDGLFPNGTFLTAPTAPTAHVEPIEPPEPEADPPRRSD